MSRAPFCIAWLVLVFGVRFAFLFVTSKPLF